MRIIVTGGAGFIGYHLCERLLGEGHHVICLDNLSTGTPRHIHALSRHACFTFHEHDITEPLQIAAEQVYNFACPASPPAYQADPVKTLLTNVVGVHNMLELARASGARFLQASTSEVYGDPLIHPQPETYRGNVDMLGPRACYDEGKRSAETLVDDYRRIYRLDVRIARIFNTYGPEMRDDDGRVISNFVVEALQDQDIGIFGDGSHTRSYCYISDMVEGLVRLMNHAQDVTYPVNLGNPVELSVTDTAQKILALTGSRSKIAHLAEPANDPHRRCPDISRATSLLGWRPEVSLEAGLANTIAYFKSVLGEESPVPTCR
jgi:UDP-glucuronate decarboxylase